MTARPPSDQSAAGPEDIRKLSAIYKAMGEPARLGMLFALRQGEACVGELARAAGMSESAASHQLRVLRNLSLVKTRREGKQVFYSLDDSHVEDLLDLSLAHARE